LIAKMLLTLAAAYMAAVGLALMVAPLQFGRGAVPTDAGTELVALLRLMGEPFLGIAVLNWLSRKASPEDTVRPVWVRVIRRASHGRAVLLVGNDHLQTEAFAQASFVEVLLHRERPAEQPDLSQTDGHDPLRSGIGDVDQRNANRALHVVRHSVHGIGADQKQVRSGRLQPPCGVHHPFGEAAPVAGMLQRLDFRKIERP